MNSNKTAKQKPSIGEVKDLFLTTLREQHHFLSSAYRDTISTLAKCSEPKDARRLTKELYSRVLDTVFDQVD